MLLYHYLCCDFSSSLRDGSCSCSNNSPQSTNPRYLTVTRSPTRIEVAQLQDGSHDFGDFEMVLRDIRFVHDPVRPPTEVTEYEAFVSVSASDGELTSDIAVSRIVVSVRNLPPIVVLGNSTATEVVMQDGQPVIPVLQVGADIIEDSDTISQVILTLNNPFHQDERIYSSGGYVSPSITVTNGSNSVTLSGPASLLDFVEALNNIQVLYSYPPMESILQGDVPDFTPR